MKLNMNDNLPFAFMQFCNDDGLVRDVALPTFVDVVFLPEGLVGVLLEQPLKRWDLCLSTHHASLSCNLI